MKTSLQETPVASRTHIGFFGRMNVGKSSLINALADQPVSIVSSEAGTTTDVVKKTMEIHGVGPCVLLDTAGFDDQGTLGSLRTAASRKAAEATDIAVVLFSAPEKSVGKKSNEKNITAVLSKGQEKKQEFHSQVTLEETSWQDEQMKTQWQGEREWIDYFQKNQIPVIAVLSHADERSNEENAVLAEKIKDFTGLEPIIISAIRDHLSKPEVQSRVGEVKSNEEAKETSVQIPFDEMESYKDGEWRDGKEESASAKKVCSEEVKSHVSGGLRYGLDALKNAIVAARSKAPEKQFIMGSLVKEGDAVLLVMPQDPQAPEGRLILPEVQTIREALDRHCVAICVQPEDMEKALLLMKNPPDLIVTDSQVFDEVYAKKPDGTKLTSFSVLFAGYKGDIEYYTKSVQAIPHLTENSRVLIAECCTHAPLDEDIGRVKIPRMLRKRVGEGLTVDVTAGADFPENLKQYDLIIQCGGCMFNRRYVNARIQKAKDAGVPMTNYGITIAWLKGILDKVEIGEWH